MKKGLLFFSFTCLILVFFLFLQPSLALAQSVVINEFSSYESSGDWIELYSAEDIDISGWILRDLATSRVKVIPEGVTIGPSTSTFYVVDVGARLDRGGDRIILLKSDDVTLVDEVVYGTQGGVCAPGVGESAGRYPDAESVFRIFSSPTKGYSNNTSTSFLCPTPTLSPTSTPTQSSTSSFATVKISQPKDQNGGDLLGSLKIYIDGNYTGNYAPETYTFGDGKTCGSNNVPCGFGTHTFKVEKTGYLPWTKTGDITAGNNYEFDPVLILSSPSPTPTIKPSPTATASATPKSTPAEISASTTSALLAEDVFSKKSVLGAESTQNTSPPEENVAADPKLKAAVLFFMLAGVSFLMSAVYAYIRSKNKKEKNEGQSNEIEEEGEETP